MLDRRQEMREVKVNPTEEPQLVKDLEEEKN